MVAMEQIILTEEQRHEMVKSLLSELKRRREMAEVKKFINSCNFFEAEPRKYITGYFDKDSNVNGHETN